MSALTLKAQTTSIYRISRHLVNAAGQTGHSMRWRLHDAVGSPCESGRVIVDPNTAIWEEYSATLPQSFTLSQNYPNPFNSTTAIRFALPMSQDVELSIFNLAGQQVATLVEGAREAGNYTVHWDGRGDGGRELASGVYLYRFRAENRQVETRKLLLIR